MTDAPPGASDDLEVPVTKLGLWLLLALGVYSTLAVVGVGLGYAVERLLQVLP